ncbi:hypothetical protein ACMXEJ_000942 [Campylobacter jejuni]|uniref:hypothetical protein n=1 Tax=Campylobacter jejuni TaxID=197 RepID=UPI00255BBC88|nr:hypothetical protein [Campylobacter jejuni]
MVNSSFIVLCTLLVLLMTPALAIFYLGMVRSKNTLNTIMNCFIVFSVITLQWVVLEWLIHEKTNYFRWT